MYLSFPESNHAGGWKLRLRWRRSQLAVRNRAYACKVALRRLGGPGHAGGLRRRCRDFQSPGAGDQATQVAFDVACDFQLALAVRNRAYACKVALRRLGGPGHAGGLRRRCRDFQSPGAGDQATQVAFADVAATSSRQASRRQSPDALTRTGPQRARRWRAPHWSRPPAAASACARRGWRPPARRRARPASCRPWLSSCRS